MCTGAEANLIGCSYGNIAQHSCSAAQAAAICLVGKYEGLTFVVKDRDKGRGGRCGEKGMGRR